ncbi:uncharacterized protein TRUGW13939_11505 [Talaromyces rugulosus]|uniref:DNA endonuclease activator Ctp1 C-terminal domain-containing protein n=1 Tax=Talaromyces rugulosus TaxID=121627 RepID=A0A7H8RF43_TALRU|nr:uncharacterized protein TRUGW13939_11505 [Talaromyces rugulosus]QKX64331.1 hypothetical protein TRUGW13939_11505 [Talaromyces rugulosus]
MDTLRRLQSSLAAHYEHAFDEAHRTLAVEISTRDSRIHELETLNRLLQDANTDEKSRVRELERQINQLEEDISNNQKEPNQEGLEKKLLALRSTYNAEQLTRDLTESRLDTTSRKFDKALQQMESCYDAIFHEVWTLLGVTDSLRTQVKRHKERATQWQRWYHQNNRDSKGQTRTMADTQEPSHPNQAGTHTRRTSSSRPLDPANNLDMNPVTSTTSEAAPAKSRATTDVGVSHGHESFVRIKPEPIPSSPILDIPSSREADAAGTQDLDDVGNLVDTPKRQSTHKEVEPLETINYDRRDKRLHALQPRDSNQMPSSREFSSKRRKVSDRGSGNISSVSEDGEHVLKHRTSSHEDTPTKTINRHPQTHSRLDELLEERPHAHRQSFDYPGAPSERRARGHSSNMAPAPKPVHGPEVDGERDLESIVQSVPYRDRPVDLLDLNCFKPNPARNEGLDYAFKEVVRNRDLRKCVPGCMRPDCCGNKFRAMVRAGGVKFEEKDRALLEEHLGENKRHTLDEMSETERRDLFIEVKARALADQFGRHRPSHDRPRSPPGFWRADMPSTQELAKDRREADRMERDKIIERLQEAMRPEGLWKFADED